MEPFSRQWTYLVRSRLEGAGFPEAGWVEPGSDEGLLTSFTASPRISIPRPASMSRFIPAGILLLLFPGCATILTGGRPVQIDTTPPGAAVSVNGILEGISPLSTDLYPGDKIKFELDNHKTRVLRMGRRETQIKPIFWLNPLITAIGVLLLPGLIDGYLIGVIGAPLVFGVGIIGTRVDSSSGRGLQVKTRRISAVLEKSENGSPN